MRIAYLSSVYPAVSQTFIVREVQALRGLGIEVETFSVRRATAADVIGLDAERDFASTVWLAPPPIGTLVISFLWVLVSRPRRFIRTLAGAFFAPRMLLRERLKWLAYFSEAVLLAHRLAMGSFDHLHCHFGNAGSSVGMLAAQLAGIPFSITCHGSELREIERYRLAEKVRRASFVACVSHFGRSQLMLACPPDQWEKLHVIRCGPGEAEQVSLGEHTQPPRILCVGRLSPEKGHLVLLDALASLRTGGVGFHCTLVGDGSMRCCIEHRIDQLKLGDRVTLTGSLEPAELDKSYRMAAVVVLASFSEGVPVVLMEAMRRGLPVVATCIGGVPELVAHRTSGLLVPAGDSAALANALQEVLTNTPLARALGERAALAVRKEFDVERSAVRLVELFQPSRRTIPSPADVETIVCGPRVTTADS